MPAIRVTPTGVSSLSSLPCRSDVRMCFERSPPEFPQLYENRPFSNKPPRFRPSIMPRPRRSRFRTRYAFGRPARVPRRVSNRRRFSLASERNPFRKCLIPRNLLQEFGFVRRRFPYDRPVREIASFPALRTARFRTPRSKPCRRKPLLNKRLRFLTASFRAADPPDFPVYDRIHSSRFNE